jgi:hypothetical protein
MSSFNIGFVIFPDLTQLDFTGLYRCSHAFPNRRPTSSRNRSHRWLAIAGWASCQRTPLRTVRPSTCSASRAEAYLPRVDRLAPVSERGVVRDHQHVRDPRQIGRQILSDPIGKILLVGVIAEIGEGQYRH